MMLRHCVIRPPTFRGNVLSSSFVVEISDTPTTENEDNTLPRNIGIRLSKEGVPYSRRTDCLCCSLLLLSFPALTQSTKLSCIIFFFFIFHLLVRHEDGHHFQVMSFKYYRNTEWRKKNACFLNGPAISFFGVTSNQKSTFENLVQSTIWKFPFAKKLQLCH